MTDLEMELKTKKICRFCLCQDEKILSNLYSNENRLKSSAPLPLQVMACVSIEVFANDGMPSTVCDNCRMLMEHCYRFKQMCNKADMALRQVPFTQKWPSQLDHPEIPQQLFNTHILNMNVPKTEISIYQSNLSPKTPEKQKPQIKKKLPNNNNLKLLNKKKKKDENVLLVREPCLEHPILKQEQPIDETIDFLTKIIDTENDKEVDPVKSAKLIETNVFPCPHCEKSFPLCQLLDIHMEYHKRERNFQCEHCEKKFFTKKDLAKHGFVHLNDKPHKCVVCEKSFARTELLRRHEDRHTDIPKFVCVHCERRFISKEELARHAERHNKKHPFSCKICDKTFAGKQGLERHELNQHVKEQPFSCQYCNLSFSDSCKLSRHLMKHAGDTPYSCKSCNKSYVFAHRLKRHLKTLTHKKSLGIFKCYDCLKTFTTKDSLISHSVVHATQMLICPICKEQFNEIYSKTEHMKIHVLEEKYACEFCDLIFMTQDKLDKHCVQNHADEMAMYKYNEHNFKYENESQEVYTGPEILQEFIIKEEIILEENDNHTGYETDPLKTNEGKRKLSFEELQPTLENTNYQNHGFGNGLVLNDFTKEESALCEELHQESAKKSMQLNLNRKKLKESSTQNLNSEMKHDIPTTKVSSFLEEVSKTAKKSDIHIVEGTIKEPKATVDNKKVMNFSIPVNTKTDANFNISNADNPPKHFTPEKSKTIKIDGKKIKVKKVKIRKDCSYSST